MQKLIFFIVLISCTRSQLPPLPNFTLVPILPNFTSIPILNFSSTGNITNLPDLFSGTNSSNATTFTNVTSFSIIYNASFQLINNTNISNIPNLTAPVIVVTSLPTVNGTFPNFTVVTTTVTNTPTTTNTNATTPITTATNTTIPIATVISTSIVANNSLSPVPGANITLQGLLAALAFIQNNPSQILIQIANYYGCKTWVNNVCIECSPGFYRNSSGVCCLVPPFCQIFNSITGRCDVCYPGYLAIQGACVVVSLNNLGNVGCINATATICAQCAYRYILNGGNCTPVDGNCASWTQTGACLICYPGYISNGTLCIVNNQTISGSDPLCSVFTNSTCTMCSRGSSLNPATSKCTLFPMNCISFDPIAYACVGCAPGYIVFNSACALNNATLIASYGCKVVNGTFCVQCALGYSLFGGSCVLIPTYCQTVDIQGRCTQCLAGFTPTSAGICTQTTVISGCISFAANSTCASCAPFYALVSGQCLPVELGCSIFDQTNQICINCLSGYVPTAGICLLPSQGTPFIIANCALWDWINRRCLSCNFRSIAAANGTCIQVSNFCNTWNQISGLCTSCYRGYQLTNGQCLVLALNNPPIDLGCFNFDWATLQCLVCAPGYILLNSRCSVLSGICKTFTSAGLCNSCYSGYSLILNGSCIVTAGSTLVTGDPNCYNWNFITSTCTQCAVSYLPSLTGLCVLQDQLCSNFSSITRTCLNCYYGYYLNNGRCFPLQNTTITIAGQLIGCLIFANSTAACVTCASGYLLVGSTCQVQNDQCLTVDSDGLCTSCRRAYYVDNGDCVYDPLYVSNTNPGCAVWDWSLGLCITCSSGYMRNQIGYCVLINDLCRTVLSNGSCGSCYLGYSLSLNGTCTLTPFNNNVTALCAAFDPSTQLCVRCSNFSVNFNGICVATNSSCNGVNSIGLCTGCFSGYNLNMNGLCVINTNNISASNPYCAVWNFQLGLCIQCANRTFSLQGICTPLNDSCATFQQSGLCASCYPGYILAANFSCIVNQNYLQPGDPNCNVWDSRNNRCVVCSGGYANVNGICFKINDNCATITAANLCASCFLGYSLNSTGQCQINFLVNANSPLFGCLAFQNNTVCLRCAFRYVLIGGGCVKVSDFCANYSETTGLCTACYVGYQLANGGCSLTSSINNSTGTLAPGCQSFDAASGLCVLCASGFIKVNNGCQPANGNCSNYSVNGICTRCYPGYVLLNSTCSYNLNDIIAVFPAIRYCAQWDWQTAICRRCVDRAVFNLNGVCFPVSDNCKNFTNTGACISCYDGYILQGGVCAIPPPLQQADPLCTTYNYATMTCTVCSAYSINNNGRCLPVSTTCATYNQQTGACITCFRGYTPVNGACALSPAMNFSANDPGCTLFDTATGICQRCSFRYYFAFNPATFTNMCMKVNDLCQTWNPISGGCMSCYTGYRLVGMSCTNISLQSNPGCLSFTPNTSICSACAMGYYMNNSNNLCILIPQNCSSFNSVTLSCNACYLGYTLVNGSCVYNPNAALPDPNCNTWNFTTGRCAICSKGFIKNPTTQSCSIQLSPFCATTNPDGSCATCYSGYILLVGTCTTVDPNQANAPEGCANFTSNGTCLTCARYYVPNNGICQRVSDFCNGYNNLGQCTDCFPGFILSSGLCLVYTANSTNSAAYSDQFCNQFSADGLTCTRCITGFAPNTTGRCVLNNPLCVAINANGTCGNCISGYFLFQGNCFSNATNMLGCIAFSGNTCTSCANGYYLSNGMCLLVTGNCLTSSNVTGLCTSCALGLMLSNGQCINSTINQGCATFNQTTSLCAQCSNRYYMSSPGICTQINSNCQNYNPTNGYCTQCFLGYMLDTQTGACNLDLNAGNCRTRAANGTCSSCYNGYIIYNEICQPLSSFASLYIYYSQCCPYILDSFKASFGI